MYKQLIIFLLLLSIACKTSNTKININQPKITSATVTVYKDGNVYTNIPPYKATVNCDDCYVYETIKILSKDLTFILPLEIENGRWEKAYSIKIKNGVENVLAFKKRTTYINTIDLYFSTSTSGELGIEKVVYLQAEDYRKKIAKNDYENIPAIKICVDKNNDIELTDTIDVRASPLFSIETQKNCVYCELENNYEHCKEEALK